MWNEASRLVVLRRVVLHPPNGFEPGDQTSVGLIVGQGGALLYVDLELVTFYQTWWSRCAPERNSFSNASWSRLSSMKCHASQLNCPAATEAFRDDTVEAAERIRAEGARLMGELDNRRALVNALLDLVNLSYEELINIINTRVVNEVMTS